MEPHPTLATGGFNVLTVNHLCRFLMHSVQSWDMLRPNGATHDGWDVGMVKNTYYSVQKRKARSAGKLFTDFTAPKGLRFRVMDRVVFEEALKSADKKARAALMKITKSQKASEAA